MSEPQAGWFETYLIYPLFGRPPTVKEQIAEVKKNLNGAKRELERLSDNIKDERNDKQKEMQKAADKHLINEVTVCARSVVSMDRQYNKFSLYMNMIDQYINMVQEASVNITVATSMQQMTNILAQVPTLTNPQVVKRTLYQFTHQQNVIKTSQEMIQSIMEEAIEEDIDEETDVVKELVSSMLDNATIKVIDKLPVPKSAELKPANEVTAITATNKIQQFLNKK
jgi:charged multivesicular body protein 2A